MVLSEILHRPPQLGMAWRLLAGGTAAAWFLPATLAGLLGWGWVAGAAVSSTAGLEAGIGGPAAGAGLCLCPGNLLVLGRCEVSSPRLPRLGRDMQLPLQHGRLPRLALSGGGRSELDEQFGFSGAYSPAGLEMSTPPGSELGERFSWGRAMLAQLQVSSRPGELGEWFSWGRAMLAQLQVSSSSVVLGVLLSVGTSTSASDTMGSSTGVLDSMGSSTGGASLMSSLASPCRVLQRARCSPLFRRRARRAAQLG